LSNTAVKGQNGWYIEDIEFRQELMHFARIGTVLAVHREPIDQGNPDHRDWGLQ